MHAEALAWVAGHATDEAVTVLDVGGRYINGTPRGLFPNADYLVLDIADGPNVDIVADAATWDPYSTWDVVVCCEVFEHTPASAEIIRTAFLALKPGGRFIVTTAAPGRLPHSGIDGMHVRDGEWYQNVDPAELEHWLHTAGFEDIIVDLHRPSCDVRAVATKPTGEGVNA